MRSQIGTQFKSFACTLAFLAFLLGGCTSSQTNSIDDEMLSETEFSQDVMDQGDQAKGQTASSADSMDDLDFSDTDQSSGDVADNDLGDLDDFEFSDENQANNGKQDDFSFDEFDDQNQAQADQKDLEQELNLDDLSAEDVVQNPEPTPLPSEPSVDEMDLGDSFDDATPFEPAPTPQTPAPQVVSSAPVHITDIRYLANKAGGSVVVDADGAIDQQTRFNPQSGQFVIEISNAVLPERLKRPYLMKDFSGGFGSINAYQAPGDNQVRVVVQLKPGYTEEPAVQVEGHSLVVVPPTASSDAYLAANTGGAKAAPHDNIPLGAGSLEEFLNSNQTFYGKPISLQVSDADILDVISMISEESGANIIVSDEVNGKVSLKLRQVPWDQALVSVMRTKGLGYVRQGNVIRISSMKTLRDESENAREILKAQKELAPVHVKVIPVNYANVDDLQEKVKTFLSKDGKVVSDPRSNSLLITDRDDILEKVSRLVTALDIQPTQVMIEGKIVEASQDFSSSIGVNWAASGSPITLSQGGGAFGTPLELTPNLSFGQSPNVSSNSLGLRLGRLDFLGNLRAALELAEVDRTAKIISSPKIVTMNLQKAEINQSGEVISVVTITNGTSQDRTTTENRIKVNLKLEVTPQITTDGSVMMDMNVLREFAGPPSNAITLSRPINSRSAKTKVLVKNGETAVIGGIYQVDEAESTSGVPLLKDIPLLGWLFKTKEKTKEKNELLIFLTPRILTAGTQNETASL